MTNNEGYFWANGTTKLQAWREEKEMRQRRSKVLGRSRARGGRPTGSPCPGRRGTGWRAISSQRRASVLNLLFASHLCLGDHRHGPALVPFSPASFSLLLDFLFLKIFFVLGGMQQNDLNGSKREKKCVSHSILNKSSPFNSTHKNHLLPLAIMTIFVQ